MQLSLCLQSDKRPDEYVALARRAEEGGLDVVSVYHDLFFQPAIAPLLLMASETERVRLGPAALNPYTLHPVETAQRALPCAGRKTVQTAQTRRGSLV